jgi:CubicO group peptidase (beta-lactamase class C family)
MQSPSEGVVLGRIINGRTEFAAAGRMSQTGPLVDEDTLFEIGSITKVFTGILLADTILQKKAALNDPISMFLPEGTIPENSPLSKITLFDLATHTSGLPRLPSDFSVDQNPTSPYNHYTRDRLFKYLSGFDGKIFGESGKYLYSNLGFGLLGEILANINNTTYSKLLQDVILDPLHMQNTFVQVSSASIPGRLKEKFAVGHDKGNPTSYWSLNAFAGAGGIVSSAYDLLLFANAQWDAQTPMRLQNASKLASRKYTDEMGLGWHINSKGLTHDGGTGGFRTQLDVSIAEKAASVLLRNGTGPKLTISHKGNFKKIAGFWQGTLDTSREKLRIIMHLTTEGTTSIYSLDQGSSIIPALKTEVEKDRFFAFFPSINGSFIGTIDDDESLITGTWEQKRKYPLEMKKSAGLPESLKKIFETRYLGNFDALVGFWSGHLGDTSELFVISEVQKLGEVYELKLWSPSQSPLPITVSMAKFHNNDLYIEIKSIDGNYKGKLSKDRKTIRGIWSQGKETAVTLHWSAVRPENGSH